MADTGIGNPTESLESIFEDFRQADQSHTRADGLTRQAAAGAGEPPRPLPLLPAPTTQCVGRSSFSIPGNPSRRTRSALRMPYRK